MIYCIYPVPIGTCVDFKNTKIAVLRGSKILNIVVGNFFYLKEVFVARLPSASDNKVREGVPAIKPRFKSWVYKSKSQQQFLPIFNFHRLQ